MKAYRAIEKGAAKSGKGGFAARLAITPIGLFMTGGISLVARRRKSPQGAQSQAANAIGLHEMARAH